ncbi:hypothetical protein [Roseateles sp. LYH14W]|uniref:DUF2306 domain-containing protein n=1 Tax=Pelomonas parva TaxID=3299032 RepID=A0ABW7EWN9_9BURK
MSAREGVIATHVLLSCGATLAWLVALMARATPWRRHHVLIGRGLVVLVVTSSVLAVGLAADSGNRFGVLFALQPLLLALSGAAQFLRSRWVVHGLGVVSLLVALGVLHGFLRFLVARDLIDVLAFAWTALTLGVLAAADLRTGHRQPWRAHAHRMLAVGWFYVAELCIFVFDPQPSVIAWAGAALVPAGAAWWLHRRPVGLDLRHA